MNKKTAALPFRQRIHRTLLTGRVAFQKDWQNNLIFYRANKFWINTSLYFALAGILLYKTWEFLSGALLQIGAQSFFFSLSAMLGGTLAIVFSLSSLQIQYAAQYASSGFYKTLARDLIRDIIFVIIIFFAFLFLFLGLIFSSPKVEISQIWIDAIAIISTSFIILIFWLLSVLYLRIYERINPIFCVNAVRKECFKHLSALERTAKLNAKIILATSKQDKELSQDYALAIAYQYLRPDFEYLNIRMEFLLEYHDKLLSQHEKRIARETLTTVFEVLDKYFSMIKTSSINVPTSQFLVPRSIFDFFINPNLERLLSRGIAYLKTEDNEGINHIINIYHQLAISSKDIKSFPKIGNENPIFDSCRSYLDQFVAEAIKANSLEALFQATRVYRQIGFIAIDLNMSHSILGVLATLKNIAFHALRNNFFIVWPEVIKGYIAISHRLCLSKYFSFNVMIRSILSNLDEVIIAAIFATRDILSIQTNIAEPLRQIQDTFVELINIISEEKNPREKKLWISIFLEFIEEFRGMLRNISEKIKSADHPIIGSLSDIISNIACTLLELSQKPEWQEIKDDLKNHANWYMHQLSWFGHYAESIEDNWTFQSLIDALSRIGLAALTYGDDKSAKECIRIIYDYAIDMLSDKGHSYSSFTSPRIMDKACYIGILAHKMKKKDIVSDLKSKIAEFQKQYEEKMNFPEGISDARINELRTEIIQLRDNKIKYDMDHSFPMRQDPERILFSKIDLPDIDLFTIEAMDFVVSGSPVEHVLDEKIRKLNRKLRAKPKKKPKRKPKKKPKKKKK